MHKICYGVSFDCIDKAFECVVESFCMTDRLLRQKLFKICSDLVFSEAFQIESGKPYIMKKYGVKSKLSVPKCHSPQNLH